MRLCDCCGKEYEEEVTEEEVMEFLERAQGYPSVREDVMMICSSCYNDYAEGDGEGYELHDTADILDELDEFEIEIELSPEVTGKSIH